MSSDHPQYESISAALARVGLLARGGFDLEPGELEPFGLSGNHRSLVMVGNAGPAMWATFQLVLTHDQEPHALDRWTVRVIEPAAERMGATVVYPFGGPPYFPFQRWAQRAEPVFPSPIGPLIHPEYGLWHAYRAALLFDRPLALPERHVVASPCDSCAERPCLDTCPVGAFSENGYDVPACADHVDSPAGLGCLGEGCEARRACPVGRDYVYEPHQARFHMEAFLRARKADQEPGCPSNGSAP